MHFASVVAYSLPLLGAMAAPRPGGASDSCATWSTTVTHTATETCTTTHTVTTTPKHSTTTKTTTSKSVSSTSSAPTSSPTAPYGVISAHSGSPIHLLPVNAAGEAFYLGGSPATYCPLTDQTQCPPGTSTIFVGLGALDVEVPGGQLVYVATDGHLGFTQAHSASYPPGAVLEPFTYSKSAGASFGDLGTNAFGATGFMACPLNKTSSTYQVFANFAAAQVPSGSVADCIGFDALTSDYTGSGAAAWEYT